MYNSVKVDPKKVSPDVYFQDNSGKVFDAKEAWLRLGWYYKYYRTESEAKGKV